MILTITATTIVISKVVLYLTTAAAASAGVGATILVQKMHDSRDQAEKIALQQLEDTSRERQEKRLDHLDGIVGSTQQEVLSLRTETTAHTQKIALNLGRLDKEVSLIDSEAGKLIATSNNLVSATETNDLQMQELLKELKAKIVLLDKASQELEAAKKALLEKEKEIVTIQEQQDVAKRNIAQHQESLDTLRSENTEKGKKIESLEQALERMSEQLSADKSMLQQASLKISTLVQTKKALLTECQSSQQLISELTRRLDGAEENPKKTASGSRPGFFA